jgi:hypothetical protein
LYLILKHAENLLKTKEKAEHWKFIVIFNVMP